MTHCSFCIINAAFYTFYMTDGTKGSAYLRGRLVIKTGNLLMHISRLLVGGLGSKRSKKVNL